MWSPRLKLLYCKYHQFMGVRTVFPGTYVPRYRCSPNLCSPVPMFPGTDVPRTYVPRYLGESGEKWAAIGKLLGKCTLIDNVKDAPIFSGIYPYNVTLLIIYLTLFCCIIIRAPLRSSNKSRVKVWRNGP